jgi:predicted PurR-regulated permease PerM
MWAARRRTIACSSKPFFVLLAVFLWTYLWGLFGAFIGVPIVIAVITFCGHHPSSRWVADLLGGPAEAKPLARS